MDVLENHYMEKLMELDYLHLLVFEDEEVDMFVCPFCPLCERVFEEATELVEHMVDKVKIVGEKSKHKNLLRRFAWEFSMEYSDPDGEGYDGFRDNLVAKMSVLSVSDAENVHDEHDDEEYKPKVWKQADMNREWKRRSFHYNLLINDGEKDYAADLDERKANGGYTKNELRLLHQEKMLPTDQESWATLSELFGFEG